MKEFAFKRLGTVMFAALVFTACITDEPEATVAETTEASTTEANPAAALLKDSSTFTSIKWDETVREMGTIVEGQKLEVVYRFTNTGSKPLVIEQANPSCGCTVPEKPEKPIMPGEQGSIKAVFNSDGRPGANHKSITVVANTLGGTNHNLEFNVEVKAKDKAEG